MCQKVATDSWDSSAFSLHPDNLTKFSGIDFLLSLFWFVFTHGQELVNFKNVHYGQN